MTTFPKSAPMLPIGKIKTFGEGGPYYQIAGNGHQAKDGEWMIPIRVVESGEELDYRYSRLALDPYAA
jgi:hypothetical protein